MLWVELAVRAVEVVGIGWLVGLSYGGRGARRTRLSHMTTTDHSRRCPPPIRMKSHEKNGIEALSHGRTAKARNRITTPLAPQPPATLEASQRPSHLKFTNTVPKGRLFLRP